MIKKKNILILLIFFIGSPLLAQDLNILTFNIRYASPNDGENQWQYRQDKIAETIIFFEADIIGMQEALKMQIDDLLPLLPNFNYVGVGRDDGKEKGEYAPIFYNKNKFNLEETHTFWLSTTMNQPSKSWDAALPRICTYAILSFKKKPKKKIYIFNTHFDHIGVEAREKSALLIKSQIEKITNNHPYLLMGDFNITPDDIPYKNIISGDFYLEDSFYSTQTPHYGPIGTFTGFKTKENPEKRIDFIFTEKGMPVLKHATLSMAWEGKYASDHFAVFAKIKPW